jgi:hypothetical protein
MQAKKGRANFIIIFIVVSLIRDTAIKLRMGSPFSLREKVRMRGSSKAFCLIFYPPHPSPLQQERELFFLT